MPFAMWRILIALLALPIIVAIALVQDTDDWTALPIGIGLIAVLLFWGPAALLLRHYRKWPWR